MAFSNSRPMFVHILNTEEPIYCIYARMSIGPFTVQSDDCYFAYNSAIGVKNITLRTYSQIGFTNYTISPSTTFNYEITDIISIIAD